MKKRLTKFGRVLYYVQSAMKYSAFLFAIVCSVTSLSIAEDSYGQQLLDTRVSVQFTDATLSEALHQIARQTRVQFVFVGAEPVAKKTTNLKVTRQSLRVVLPKLLEPYGLSYQVVDNRIVIKSAGSPSTHAKPEDSEAVHPNPLENRPNLPMSPELMRRLFSDFRVQPPLAIRISGRVTDEKGEGLPGVNIIVKGTQQGTTTTVDGNFQIDVPNGNSILIFSFVGYVSQEIAVGSKTILEIKLSVD